MSGSYQHFYNSQIYRALSSDGEIAGLINVEGPTGIGKTSSLLKSSSDAGKAVINTIAELQRKAIFVTHRWNILTDFSKSAKNAEIAHSVLYSRVEQISSAVCGHALPHEEVSPANYTWESELEYLKDKELWVHPKVSISALHKTCAAVARIHALLFDNRIDRQDIAEVNDNLERELHQLCSKLEHSLLENLVHLDRLEASDDKPKKRRNSIAYAHISKLTEYRKSRLIRRALPGVEWRDDDQTLLIMTTHKLYHGYYDGKKRVRLGEAGLSGFVIFIDEFEYQEPVLLDLLSQEQRIQELPQCLGVLLDEGKRLIIRAKLGNEKDEELNNVLSEIREGFDQAISAMKEKGIDFPNDRALIRSNKEDFEERCLFSSQYFISLKPTYLLPSQAGLEIVKEKKSLAVSANFFLTELEKLLRKTLFCISKLSSDLRANSAKTLQEEFLHLIFNSVNDYRLGHYHRSLNCPSFLSAAPNTNLPELQKLLGSDELRNTKVTIHGFSCWLLTQAPEQLDNLRIEQRRAHIPTTPEALIVALASSNLVFGLSATSMVSRSIGNFDLKWVYGALQEIATERSGDSSNKPAPIVPNAESNELLKSTVEALKSHKASIRRNLVSIEEFELGKSPGFAGDGIIDALPGDYFDIGDESPSEGTKVFREKCLLSCLNILMLVASENNHRGHLAYLNSMRFVREWFSSKDAYESRAQCSWLEPLDQTILLELGFPNSFVNSNDFKVTKVNGVIVTVCFLNAEAQKNVDFDKHYQLAFGLSAKVLVLTQIASATNGVNLDYYLSTITGGKQAQDLTCVYLLEGRHYFFSSMVSDYSPKSMAQVGAQIRSLQKLRQSTQISEKNYRYFIGALMSQDARAIQYLNSDIYKNTRDYVANIVADIQQQLGRLERVWSEVPFTKIVVQIELAETVKRYAADPFGFEHHRHSMSTLNEAFFGHFKESGNETSFLNLLRFAPQNDSNAIEFIDNQFVNAIRQSRIGEWEGCKTVELKRSWDKLGEAFLRRDLCFEDDYSKLGLIGPNKNSLKNWACAKLPLGADTAKGVWVTKDGRYSFNSTPDSYHYRPSAYYRWVQHHEYITNWFVSGGYATSANTASGDEECHVFFPSLAQRILQGRIGEEAIRGLLNGYKVETSTALLSERCFELYDFFIPGTNYFVDAKYWGTKSLLNADEEFEAYLDSGDQELAPMAMPQKLAHLRNHLGKEATLVIANLVGFSSDAKPRFYDAEFQNVAPQLANIIIIPGCLDPDHKNKATNSFIGFVELIEKTKAEKFKQHGGSA